MIYISEFSNIFLYIGYILSVLLVVFIVIFSILINKFVTLDNLANEVIKKIKK